MRRVVRLLKVPTDDLLDSEGTDGLDGNELLEDLAGYIPEHPYFAPSQGIVKAWAYVVVVTNPSRGLETNMIATPRRPQRNGDRCKSVNETHPAALQLRPVGQAVPVTPAQPKRDSSLPVRTLRPVGSGNAYRITSPPARGVVAPELAEPLETVFQRFAQEHGFTSEKPLEIQLSRGFKAGSHGHGEGRAADIAAIDGKSLLQWKQEWDQAMADVEKLSDPQQQDEEIAVEQKRNLGYGLYKALQAHSGWRVDQHGWRPYRGVMQLFGPWTATEGPWKTMHIQDPTPYQRQRLADQHWVFKAHQDHIHVAR
jgi:hypothetical protein